MIYGILFGLVAGPLGPDANGGACGFFRALEKDDFMALFSKRTWAPNPLLTKLVD